MAFYYFPFMYIFGPKLGGPTIPEISSQGPWIEDYQRYVFGGDIPRRRGRRHGVRDAIPGIVQHSTHLDSNYCCGLLGGFASRGYVQWARLKRGKRLRNLVFLGLSSLSQLQSMLSCSLISHELEREKASFALRLTTVHVPIFTDFTHSILL